MKLRISRWGVLAVVVPLALFALLRAQEGDREVTPPASVPPPAQAARPADDGATAGNQEAGEEELLPPGERLSADNNLSWPVDI